MKKLSDEEIINELKVRFNNNKKTLDELRLLNKELKEVNQKLEESEKMKSHFISNITNELINPFASIMGLADHLNKIDINNIDRVKSFSRILYEEAFDLDFQLKNIFAAAKIEAGEFSTQISRVRMIDLIKNVINIYESLAAKKNIKLQFFHEKKIFKTDNEFFKTDSDKLQLIISNLLNNSIKYGHKDSVILIATIITDGEVVISIKDKGIGIEEKDMDIIFDRFSRINKSINSENKGLGLGLSVIKETIELLHGSIKPVKLEEGIEFIINIPECKTDEEIKEFSLDGNEFLFDDNSEIF